MRKAVQKTPITLMWKALHGVHIRWWKEHGNDVPLHRYEHRLYPFMNWCARKSIAPEWVSDKAISDYVAMKTFETETFRRYAENTLRRQWNFAAYRVPGWPSVFVSRSPYRHELPNLSNGQITSFAEAHFHPDLVADVRRFRASGGFLDLSTRDNLIEHSHRARMDNRLQEIALSDQARVRPRQPLRPLTGQTLYVISRVIYMTATALHLEGEADLSEVRSIADVITPQGAALLADACEKRLGPKRGRKVAANRLRYFYSIAIRCGLAFTHAEHEVLHDLKNDLGGFNQCGPGISERNLEKLMQFDDERKFCMLLALPDVIMDELECARHRKGRVGYFDARLARLAVGVALLNTMPIRRITLVSLDMNRNLIKPKGGRPKLLIHADQEKTGKILEAWLSANAWKIISLYCRHYRPALIRTGSSSYLFPGRVEGHTGGPGFADAVKRLVRSRIGVHINPHLWRHLMSSKLAEATGKVEDAEKLLGHSPSSRATRKYARLRSKTAAERLSEITERARIKGVALLRVRAKRSVRRRMQGSPSHTTQNFCLL